MKAKDWPACNHSLISLYRAQRLLGHHIALSETDAWIASITGTKNVSAWMDIDETIKNLDCYYSLEKLAERAGLTPDGLRNKLFELRYLDVNDRPVGTALQSKKSCYHFYDEDGHVDGEWLWHRDVLELLDTPTSGMHSHS